VWQRPLVRQDQDAARALAAAPAAAGPCPLVQGTRRESGRRSAALWLVFGRRRQAPCRGLGRSWEESVLSQAPLGSGDGGRVVAGRGPLTPLRSAGPRTARRRLHRPAVRNTGARSSHEGTSRRGPRNSPSTRRYACGDVGNTTWRTAANLGEPGSAPNSAPATFEPRSQRRTPLTCGNTCALRSRSRRSDAPSAHRPGQGCAEEVLVGGHDCLSVRTTAPAGPRVRR
jgi:hypothetical protein